jgi:hypothetical protein
MDSTERREVEAALKNGQTATAALAEQAIEHDDVTHWSHYNGAFTALLIVLEAGGHVPESVVATYRDVFHDFDIDPDDYQED